MAEKEIHMEVHRDDEASKLGMWLFIFTELLLFGGLFWFIRFSGLNILPIFTKEAWN